MAATCEDDLCEDFFGLISVEEKKQIPENLTRKLQDVWVAKLKEVTGLKVENEKQRLNADQEKFQLEKQLVGIRSQFEEESRLKDEIQNQKEKLTSKVSKLSDELQAAKSKVTSLTRDIEHTQNEKENASSQSAAMAGSLESRNRQIQELQEQIHNLNEQLSQTTQAKCEAVIHAEEANSRELQLKYREKRLEQENALLSRTVSVVQHQLEQRAEESVSQRREHSSIILGLQTDLSHKIEELRVEKEEKEQLQKQLEDKSQRIQELLDTLNASRESEVKLEETFRQELVAQKKLADIYQGSALNEKERAAELENAVEELRKLLQEASEQYGALERSKAKADEEHAEAQKHSALLVKDLKEELDKVNILLEASAKKDRGGLDELSPAASAASHLVSRGLSLTQLYSEYVSVSEKFMASEEENKRLKRYVDQILKEIEERVPALKKQRDDHQRSLETITSLHAQLEDTLVEMEKQRLEADEARRRTNYFERENKRLDSQVKDLSKQVTILVSQVEAVRSGHPPPPIPKDTSKSPTVAGDVISQRLVAFRDIVELQEQNNNLRASLRELSDQMESVEHSAVDAKTKELKEELESAKEKLTELSAARERQESLMENLVHQRDMYRTLLVQQSPKTAVVSKPAPASQTPQSTEIPEEEMKKLKEELEKAKNMVDNLKKEHEDYRIEKTKNDKLMQDEYNNLRATMEKTRNENIKLVSQAEYNDERIKAQQNNTEILQRQIASLEKNNSTLQGIIGRHEGTIETLRSEYMAMQKKLSHAEVNLENLREERTLLKESEARLLAERESMNRGKTSQAMVLANLETIKINLERKDSEAKMRYENQVADLTRQVSRLKAKLESNSDLKAAQDKVSELEARIRTMHAENAATTKQLLDVKVELAATKSRMNDLLERARVSPSPGARARGSSPVRSAMPSVPLRMAGPPFHVRDLEMQLSEEKARSTTLQSALDQSKRSVNELMELSKQHEKQLTESNEACKTAKEEFNKLQKEAQEAETKLAELQDQLRDAIEEGETAKTLLKSKLAKTEDELHSCQKQLNDINEAHQKAKEDEEKAKKEAQEQSKLSAEVQDKYEREVMLHGADLKALAALKERQAEHNTELQEATSARLKAEEAVRDTRLGFEERENVLRRENKDLLVRCNELEEQNKSILDQFTTLSDKMAAIQAKLASSANDSGSAPFTEDEARSSDQLREVIKYLRRERDVASGKCEVAQAENQRLEAQRNILKNQVDKLTKDLSEEREKNQVSANTAGRYAELLRKVHTMDALADSNRLMREEKESLHSSYEEYKTKFEALERQIEPLQEKQRFNVNKIEALLLEKKTLQNEKEMFKKRTQELVEKLNHAKPEDFVKLQQDVAEQQKALQTKETEINRLKNQLAQLSKNQQMIVNQKNQFQQQLNVVREELRKANEEAKKNLMEKIRIQQQGVEDNKRITSEKARLQQQLLQSQERVRGLESSSQQAQATHQQEMGNMLELKQREEAQRHQLEVTKKDAENLAEKLKDVEGKLAEAVKKAENFEKQSLQLRKIATKYKKAAEGGPVTTAGGDGTDGEANVNAVTATSEKIKEFEEIISTLRQKQESVQEECTKLQQEINTLKQNLSSKESENSMLKSQTQQKDEELAKLRVELEAKTREVQAAQTLATQLKQSVSKQIADFTKRLEESQSKKQMHENRIGQLEKERDQLSREVESLNKKLQMQQRQLENLQKQAAGVSKPSTSGVSSDKSGFEPPPTANIKPMNAPVAPSASPRSQTATQVVPPSRAIPTASIRPMAPPSGGSAPPQGSTVMVVSPLETHSDGMVSSTVTLPQATVTPTPAISTPTLLTTATTTPSATTTMTTTLTATVSPTPASVSLTTPVAPAAAISSITASQSSSQSSSATQCTLASQSSTASQSTTVVVESTPATQSTIVAQSTPTTKASGLQTSPASSSTVASQSTLASQSTSMQQTAVVSTSVVAPIVSVTAGGTGVTAVVSSKAPTGSVPHVRQQESQEVSADALVSQAIALVSPLSSQEVAGPSGISSQKRKLDSAEAVTNTKDAKRSCLEDDAHLSAEDAGPSSSHAEQENDDASHTPDNEEDVILLDSDDEPEEYADQGDDDDDDDEEDDEDDDEQMDDDDQDQGIHAIETDDDDNEAMDRDEAIQECSHGLDSEAGQNTREAEEDLGDAEAEASSQVSADAEDSCGESQETPSESHRPQPSAGPSQPSSSSRGADVPSQTSPRTPLVLPRPAGRQERLGSVGRQTLAPFNQLPQYEEGGDDSIVPSTPTLFVPRRGDGFSEAVSSPQVPSGGFVFGSNPELSNPPQTSGLAQMAEGGLIDDTRIDLGQLDEGNRSQPSTPQHRSPTADLSAEGGVSTSEGDSMHRDPPTILVTGAEQSNEENSQDSEGNFTEADSMAAEVGEDVEDDDDDDGGADDDVIGLEEEDGEEAEADRQASEAEERVTGDSSSQPAPDVSSVPSSTPSSLPSSSQQRRITPITWDDSPQRNRRGSGFPMGRRGRGFLRNPNLGGRGFNPMMHAPPLMRGGPQRARRSRPGPFTRGPPMMSSKLEPLVDAVIVSSLNAGAECIQVYDTATGTQLKSYRGSPAAPSTVCLIGFGAYMMTAQRDKPFLQAWAIHRHEALQIRLVVPGRVSAMAVNPTGPKYCVIGIKEKLYIYKLLSGRLLGVASRHYQPITRLKFTPCGNYFASGGEDGFVYLWSLASFIEALHKYDSPQVQPHFVLGQHSDKVTDLTMTSAGVRGFLISSSLDRTARVFDLVTGRSMYTLVTTDDVTSVACNGLGSQVFLGHSNGTVNVVNLLPPPPHGDVQVSSKGVECHQNSVRHLVVTASGNHLISGGDDGEVKVWLVIDTTLGTQKSTKARDPHLALQRTVHVGCGPITNLSMLHTEREILTATELDMKEVIAPFSQDHSSPLAAPITVPVRGRGKQHLRQLDLFNFTPELCGLQSSEETVELENDLHSRIMQLQAANSRLYNFAIEHIIGEER